MHWTNAGCLSTVPWRRCTLTARVVSTTTPPSYGFTPKVSNSAPEPPTNTHESLNDEAPYSDMEDQSEREGITITFTGLLSDCTFAGNALTYVGGASPYNAVYGRQPRMLPDLLLPGDDDPLGETLDGRRERRVREIALQNMIGATSFARVNRALGTRTSHSDRTTYNPGDLVDYHRRGGSKDESGWHGPVRVVRNAPELGQVIVKLNGQERPCRLQDVRHTLLVFSTYLSGYLAVVPDIAEHTLNEAIAILIAGIIRLYGICKDSQGKWSVTRAAAKDSRKMPLWSIFVTRAYS